MLYGMYVSAAGALANAYRQDVAANNLANVDTVAFKRDLAMYQARKTAAQETGRYQHSSALLEGQGGGVYALPTATDFKPASLDEVGDAYSLGLAGKGFFQVLKDGQSRLTRDGRLAVNEESQLVLTGTNYPILSDQGTPITVDRDLPLQVDQAGVVSQGGSAVAKLSVVDTKETSRLTKEGNNLYKYPAGTGLNQTHTIVKQGYTENSGVDPTQELVNMIEAQRLYQMNLNMLTVQDQTLSQAITKLGALG